MTAEQEEELLTLLDRIANALEKVAELGEWSPHI